MRDDGAVSAHARTHARTWFTGMSISMMEKMTMVSLAVSSFFARIGFR